MSHAKIRSEDIEKLLQRFSDGKCALRDGKLEYSSDDTKVLLDPFEIRSGIRFETNDLVIETQRIKMGADGAEIDFKIV
jgi:hypothetical protein